MQASLLKVYKNITIVTISLRDLEYFVVLYLSSSVETHVTKWYGLKYLQTYALRIFHKKMRFKTYRECKFFICCLANAYVNV